eukprot:779-Heterococcus_DN1.PRE.1
MHLQSARALTVPIICARLTLYTPTLLHILHYHVQSWLAGGFAVKVERGDSGSMNEFAVKLRTLGAFQIIQALLMLLYVLHLGLFKHRTDGAPTAVAAHNNAAPVTTQKRVDDHHHNAAMNA